MKRKCGSGGVTSAIYKQASLTGRLMIPTNKYRVIVQIIKCDNHMQASVALDNFPHDINTLQTYDIHLTLCKLLLIINLEIQI